MNDDGVEVLGPMGQGAQATVWLCKIGQHGKLCVCKVPGKDEHSRAAIVREADILHAMGEHPNVVKLIGVTKCGVVLEKANTDLFKCIEEGGPLKGPVARRLMDHLQAGLKFIHEEGVIHADMKPENILVFKGVVFKIADFGHAKQEDERVTVVCGSPLYLDPAVVLGTTWTRATDYFSTGVLMHVAFTGNPPFDPFEYAGYFATPEDLRFPEVTDPFIRNSIHALLRLDPKTRGFPV
jgi:serine/threonine protein kinase